MTYIFTTNPHNQKNINDYYGVDYKSIPKNEKALFQIAWYGWKSSEVKNIIDKTQALNGDEEYEFQVPGSDFIMLIDKNEVYFYDWHTENEQEDFKWTTEKFIEFMKAFQEFLKEEGR